MKPFVFIRVPRTGGTSIDRCIPKHRKWAPHTKRKDIDTDSWTFGFIRNPWDRMVSLHAHTLRDFNLFADAVVSDSFLWPGDAMEWLDGCDYIGKFESLQDDFDHICNVIGISKTTLDHLNKSSHGNYHLYYDDDLAEIIAVRHRRTIEFGGYVYGS